MSRCCGYICVMLSVIWNHSKIGRDHRKNAFWVVLCIGRGHLKMFSHFLVLLCITTGCLFQSDIMYQNVSFWVILCIKMCLFLSDIMYQKGLSLSEWYYVSKGVSFWVILFIKRGCLFLMNNYIVRSYRDVIVITKFAITKFAARRASKAHSIVMY